MAITTLAQLQTAKRQSVTFTRNVVSGQSSSFFYTSFAAVGEPSGTLAGSNTANGIVPTSSDAGYPRIQPFASGALGYIKTVRSTINDRGRIALFDRLFLAGAYPRNANTTLTSQPSFASRVPNTDYSGLELWIEISAAFDATSTVTVGYTNQSGVNSRSTSFTFDTVNQTLERAFLMPFQSGDSGIQSVNSVQCSTTATTGTFNIMVLRRLGDFGFESSQIVNSDTMFDGFVLEPVYSTSALYILSLTAGSNSGLPRIQVQIAEG